MKNRSENKSVYTSYLASKHKSTNCNVTNLTHSEVRASRQNSDIYKEFCVRVCGLMVARETSCLRATLHHKVIGMLFR